MKEEGEGEVGVEERSRRTQRHTHQPSRIHTEVMVGGRDGWGRTAHEAEACKTE